MGGQGALLLAFKYPALFSSAIGMAPGLCTGEELLVRQALAPSLPFALRSSRPAVPAASFCHKLSSPTLCPGSLLN